MSIYGPEDPDTAAPGGLPADAATKTYVNMQDAALKAYVGTHVEKAGDTMTGNLNMGGNLVTGLPTSPQLYRGDEAVSWAQTMRFVIDAANTLVNKDGDTMTGTLTTPHITGLADPVNPQDAASKAYVDGRKPVITIWAEESGSINGGYEWSFGNGASGPAHGANGYLMMVSGRILRLGLSAVAVEEGSGNITPALDDVVVSVVVDGQLTDHSVTKAAVDQVGTATLAPPLEVNVGSVINFVTHPIPQTAAASRIVSALIELDL